MRSTGIGTVLLAAGALVVAAATPSCSDALRVEPPATTTTTGSSGSGGEGGVAPGGGGGGAAPGGDCRSSADCSAPTGACDTVLRKCVQCLSNADCAIEPGTQCSQGECTCGDDASYCPGAGCVDLDASSDHCGSCGTRCLGSCDEGSCVGGWEAVSDVDAPSPRARHVAVWTGSVMLVWGGQLTSNDSAHTSTGGMYDPVTHTWTATSLVDAPTPRRDATAVWTGDRMIVWGGYDGQSPYLDSGGVFDPGTNAWKPMSQVAAPTGRHRHTAVWTGDEMIVFGGYSGNELSSGGHYDPDANAWDATGVVGVSRADHGAVWAANTELMYVHGGFGDTPSVSNTYLPTPGSAEGPGTQTYNPATKVWGQLVDANEPSPRAQHSLVHDGTSLIVWGGTGSSGPTSTGGRFTNSWAVLTGLPPAARILHTAVWLDGPGRVAVFGGVMDGLATNTGGLLDPTGNSWQAAPPTALDPRREHVAVSTGDSMIVWGGRSTNANAMFGDGGIYRP